MTSYDCGRPSARLEVGCLTRSRALLLSSTVLLVSVVAGPLVVASSAYAASGGAGGTGAGGNGGATEQNGSPGGNQGGAGGAAGLVPGANGADGVSSNGVFLGAGGGGGGGGGGGANGGGNGGNGGNGSTTLQDGGGGGGGGGGNGVVSTVIPVNNIGNIEGGDGGDGGVGNTGGNVGGGGAGGEGGAGIVGTGTTITNSGAISGGAGGAGGAGASAGAGAGAAGANGAGGVGITGSGLTITNTNIISGGLGGDGVTRANAIEFTGGVNVLNLTGTSVITGNVVGATATDTLGLGGASTGTLNLPQYQGFGILSKSGASLWTLSGTPGSPLNYVVSAGELNLGGTTQSTPSFIITGGTLSNGTLTVTGGAAAIDAQAGTVSAVLAGTGGLTKSTAGTVTLSSTNTYSGGTTVNGGTLALGATNALGAAASATVVNNDSVLDLGGFNQTQNGGLTQNGTSVVRSTVNGLGVTPTAATTFTTGTYTLNGGTLSAPVIVSASAAHNVNAGTVNGVLAGAGALTKATAGTVSLNNTNTYTGGTTVSAGTLILGATNALGAAASATVVNNDSVLDLGGFNQTQNGGLTQNGTSVVRSTVNGLGVTPTAATTFTTGTYTLNGGTLSAPVIVSASAAHNVNAGTVNGVLAGAGALTKATAGTVSLNNTNTYTGGTTVDAGTLALGATNALGATTGSTTVNNAAVLDLGGFGQTQNGGLTQNGTSTVTSLVLGVPTAATFTTGTYTLNGGTLGAPVTVAAGTLFDLRNGLVDGVLADDLVANPAGTALEKNTDGTVGGGLVTLTNDNTYTGDTTINAGTLTIAAGGSIAGDAFVPTTATTNATFNVLGRVGGDVTNFRTTNVIGTVVGGLRTAGTGEVGGDFTNSAGTLTLTNGAIAGVLTNSAGATTNVTDATALPGGVVSNSTVGSIDNAGLISFQNGRFGDSLTTSPLGGYAATGPGAALALDFNNLAPEGAQDTLSISGTATGQTDVTFTENGARRLFAAKTVIFATSSPTATFDAVFVDANGVPVNNGLIAYNLVRNGNNFQVVSTLDANAAGAAAGAVTSSVVAVGTGFIDAASAFISSPANPEADQVTFGFWGRTKGGKYDIDTGTDVSVAGGTDSSASTTFRTSFWGYQFGADFGRLNVGGSGINLHGGLTAGDIDIDTDAKNGSSHADTKAPFIGIYGAATGGGFFADLQVQRNFYRMKLDVPAAGLRNDKVKGDGYSIVFSGGKVIPLNDTWFIEPSVGLNYVTVDTDSVRFDAVGKVKVDDVESLLGRLGLRVGTAFQATENLILRPAVAASVWHEFQGDAGSSFVPDLAGTPSADIKTSRIGTFGQIGLSLSGQMVDSGLLGFVRADYRKGKDIDGYAFTGGLRTQF